MRGNSSAIGSFTFRMRSASPQTSSAEPSTPAPARSNSASRIELPSPAPRSISTRWPPSVSARTPAGVTATRYSWSFSSRGMPTSMVRAPFRWRRRDRPKRPHAATQLPGPRWPSVQSTRPGGPPGSSRPRLRPGERLSGRAARGGPTGRGVGRRRAGRVGAPAAGAQQAVEAERDQRLGVARRVARGALDRLVEVERDHLKAGLLPVARRSHATQRPHPLDQEQVDHLVAPTRRGVEGGQPGQLAALDVQLLGQLPPERVLHLLAPHVVLAGGDLEHALAGRVAPLVDQEDASLLVDDERGHRPRVLDHLAPVLASVRADDPVDPPLDQLADERPLGPDDAEVGSSRAGHRRSRSPSGDSPRPTSTG